MWLIEHLKLYTCQVVLSVPWLRSRHLETVLCWVNLCHTDVTQDSVISLGAHPQTFPHPIPPPCPTSAEGISVTLFPGKLQGKKEVKRL
jgi:hypothetical protein